MDQLTQIFRYAPLDLVQLYSLAPLFILSVMAIVVLIVSAGKGEGAKRLASNLSLITLWLVMGILTKQIYLPTTSILGDILIFNPLSRALSIALLGIGFFSIFLVNGQVKKDEHILGEIYPLILLSLAGMLLLAATNHLTFIFIAIEVMSLAVYVLVGLNRTQKHAAEASMKYFILGGVASALFLYGASLVYGATGTFALSQISQLVSADTLTGKPLLVVGGILMLAGMLFKVGSFPFHFWVPDVYQGASHSVTAFMSSAVKFAVFIPLIKISQQLFFTLQGDASNIFYIIFWVAAVFTMVFANIAALGQFDLKRLLAYSSIAHTGYLLTGVVVLGTNPQMVIPLYIYLAFYALSQLGALAVVVILSEKNQKDISLEDLSGLGEKYPALALCLTVFIFAMAGIPLTAGFIGKYFLFNSVVSQGETLLIVIAVLSSLISVYYYLRVIVFMFMKEEKRAHVLEFSIGPVLVVALMVILTLQFGVFPRSVISLFAKLTQ
jgi:NADH-quinone oxidoreductase subunit N